MGFGFDEEFLGRAPFLAGISAHVLLQTSGLIYLRSLSL